MKDYIITTFEKEFGVVGDKFEPLSFSVTEITGNKLKYNPGVYVFYTSDKIWKVGKSNDNTIKRALEHFTADTGSGIGKGLKQFENDSNMNLFLFVVKDREDLHWVCSLECFLELKFRKENNLEIHSARIC